MALVPANPAPRGDVRTIAGPLWRVPYRVAFRAVSNFIADAVPRMGASLSYYAAFSLAPLMVITLLVASFALDSDQLRDFVLGELSNTIGTDAAAALEKVMAGSELRQSGGWWSSLVALGITLLGASFVVSELKTALDDIFGHHQRVLSPPWYSMVAVRLRTMSIILVLAILMLVSLVLSAVLSGLTARWGSGLPVWSLVLRVIDIGLGIGVAATLFFFLYQFFPRNPPTRSSAIIGAVVAALLFAVGKHVIGLYIGMAGTASAWGAAGSLAVVLIWVYYTSQIMLFGAEVAKASDCVRLEAPKSDQTATLGEGRSATPAHPADAAPAAATEGPAEAGPVRSSARGWTDVVRLRTRRR